MRHLSFGHVWDNQVEMSSGQVNNGGLCSGKV